MTDEQHEAHLNNNLEQEKHRIRERTLELLERAHPSLDDHNFEIGMRAPNETGWFFVGVETHGIIWARKKASE